MRRLVFLTCIGVFALVGCVPPAEEPPITQATTAPSSTDTPANTATRLDEN